MSKPIVVFVFALAAALIMACLSQAAHAHNDLLIYTQADRYWRHPVTGKAKTTLPVRKRSYHPVVVNEIVIPEVKTGDIITVYGTRQVTSECKYAVGITWRFWARHVGYSPPLWGQNITREIHHLPLQGTWTYVVPRGMKQYTIRLNATAYSTKYLSRNCRTIKLDRHSNMTVRIERPER